MGGALVALLLIAGGWLLVQSGNGQEPTGGQGSIANDASEGANAPVPNPEVVPAVAGSPRRIVIPALSVDAPVDSIRTTGRTLAPPSDPQRIGWWADGARPGARSGTALLTGHTVHTGGGAFDDLEDLASEDQIRVYGDRVSTAYTVVSVQTISREDVAARHRQLFDQSGPGRLVLVTCEDWDGQAYQSSVIVTAEQVDTPGSDTPD